jgi:fumarate hydratase class I
VKAAQTAARRAAHSAAKPAVTVPKPAAKPVAATGPDPQRLRESFLEIIRKTSAELPADVIRAIDAGRSRETPDSNALWAMQVIGENIELAKENSAPLCQDTGTIIVHIRAPRGYDEPSLHRAIEQSIVRATEKGYLRQNSVDSLTGRNSGNNLGPGSPVVHVHQWSQPGLDVRLILKGGGCENVGAQYSLPDTRLGAGRDLAGVETCILDAAYQAQGKGCGPGILGVCIGGDRASGYEHSKEQFLRTLEDANPVPELAALESRVVEEANRLGIGPMGFGGTTTLLGCKVGVLNRLPASFFVSISYMCWAYRRQGAVLDPDGSIRKWLY